MALASGPVVDFYGRPIFVCSACGGPVTDDDFFELGLRYPEPGESKDDYRGAELLDQVDHVDCRKAARAS
ncbi:MAG: hypothetical protein M3P30_08410 [Chloroflexota bacterium]|nr:hypothetical protein [Chloroflexota bacterium]